jgi:hypothetical protein
LNIPNPVYRVVCDGGTEVASDVGIAVTGTLAAPAVAEPLWL